MTNHYLLGVNDSPVCLAGIFSASKGNYSMNSNNKKNPCAACQTYDPDDPANKTLHKRPKANWSIRFCGDRYRVTFQEWNSWWYGKFIDQLPWTRAFRRVKRLFFDDSDGLLLDICFHSKVTWRRMDGD